MKLYYAPGTCSLVPHIVLRETGTPFALARVDLRQHRIEGGGDLHAVNPKGKVPVLELSDGRRLTEGSVIAQFIAEQAAAHALLPPPGDPARYRVLEWQAYVSSEMHKVFSPLFNPRLDPVAKRVFVDELRRKFLWIDTQLSERAYLTGAQFTLADAYLFVVAGWSRLVGLNLADLPHLQAWLAGIAARPAVRDALQAEASRAEAPA